MICNFYSLLQKTVGRYSLMSKEFSLVALLALYRLNATFLAKLIGSYFFNFSLVLYKSMFHARQHPSNILPLCSHPIM